ncbi:MAG: addiction module toxin RelE [Chitinophagaceae bacterium]|nr:addiction module toxin RelE [Chitinophagaceae bacterium]
MRIIKRNTLLDLAVKYPQAKKQLDIWYDEVIKAKWRDQNDVKLDYPKASILKNNRVVFDIVGGSYRLIVKVEYRFQVVYILFFGTHREYDKVDADTIDLY